MKKQIIKKLNELLPYFTELEIIKLIEKDGKLEYFPCFKLAKYEKKSPIKIAENLAKQLKDFNVNQFGAYINWRYEKL